MQLTSLEIFGFKSFADRTKFIFDGGITGIVGPNGCGKSNIVDSIRWVLGEQKTRNLRSDKMENIIFNGTKHRRKANVAEVSLTFENTNNILPTEYSTITITRKLYRSGESEYMINGVVCRLKDIFNLFLDTGVSSDSYAIIELKMVDEILSNKHNERMKFFEEAAGISKYKLRKRQTLKRLSDTDADLERVDDLLFEIEKNLKSLEKQARRTQRYFELKEQYKQISSQFAFLSMQSIHEKQQQFAFLEKDYEDKLIAIQSEMAQREARIQELKKQLLDDEKNLSEAQFDLNKHIRQIQSVETEKSIKNERLKYLQQREIAIQNQMQNERRLLQRNEADVATLSSQQKQIMEELRVQEELELRMKSQVEVLKGRNTEQQSITQTQAETYREIQQATQHLIREREVKAVQISSLEAELARAEEDKSQRFVDLDAFGNKAKELKAETDSLSKQVNELSSREEQHRVALEQTEIKANDLKDQVYKTNRLLDAKQNEYNLTKSLVENLEGFPESVKFLKKNAQWISQAPLLSDVFTCPDELRIAFENYLDPYLSYYIVKSRQDAILAIHLLADSSKGRANFFILDELDSYKASNPLIFTQAAAALDVVEFAAEYRKLAAFLLDNVYMVDHENDFPENVPDDTVFLAKAGNMSQRPFVLSGGSLGLFEGKRLGRAKNLEKLQKEIARLQKRLTGEKVELDKTLAQLQQLKGIDIRKELEPAQRQLVEKQRDLSALSTREKEYREFLARVGMRTESLEQELLSLREAMIQIEPDLRLNEERQLQLATQLAQNKQLSQELGEELNRLSQQYNQEHIKLIHLRNQADNLEREIVQKDIQIKRYDEISEQLTTEKEQVIEDTDQLIRSNLADDETIVHLYEKKKQMETRVGTMEQKVGLTKSSIHQVEDSLSSGRKKREDLLIKQNQLKESGTDIRIEISSLKERMSVEFKVDLNELTEEELFDKPLDSYHQEEIEEKLHKVRQRVQNFGEINPLAVEAFNEMKERYDFINGQRQDLLDAKQSLLDTISEIDEKAKQRFLITYNQVRENFQKVFRTLFSEDDTCDLILRDPENPLESEISIIARPKGKRPLTINQLSGGEKTLTAVALLFAIYLIKPAPFCIFDEVDAPLDDANIDKFNNIIRDFSQQSQFIIVTHNKRTMASTNVMYGVTMKEGYGFSEVLPVDLETLNLN